MTTLVLLNQCLRLDDNPLLTHANGALCAVVTLDANAFFGKQYGIHRANLARLQQQLTLIADFRQQLANQGIGLVPLLIDSRTAARRQNGEPDQSSALLRLAATVKATHLLAAEPTGPEEYRWLAGLSKTLECKLLDVNSLLGDHLAPSLTTLPDRFTTFRKTLEPLLSVSPPISPFLVQATQAWLTPHEVQSFCAPWQQFSQQYDSPHAPMTVIDTEAQAWQRLTKFIWQTKQILTYKTTRNGLLGDEYASLLSSPLALGTLSARRLWQQISQFETQVDANESTYWLKFELLWREFFRWQMRKYQQRWFSQWGIKRSPSFTPPTLTVRQQQAWRAWCAGNTGVPFVDANMRLLNQTGLMSNRGRQNVASYLIHDLQLDWRLGAAYFEQRLRDYDVASNWGNWAYIAGFGNSEARPFNIIKQALMYDPDAAFVNAMLPEITATGKRAHFPQTTQRSALPAHWHRWLAELD